MKTFVRLTIAAFLLVEGGLIAWSFTSATWASPTGAPMSVIDLSALGCC